LAQLLWARGHAEAGDFEVGLRNYRQVAERSRGSRGSERGPAPRFALELAAAEARAGRLEDARRHLGEAHPRAGDREALPRWALEALAELEHATER
jgi:hypothetical protein